VDVERLVGVYSDPAYRSFTILTAERFNSSLASLPAGFVAATCKALRRVRHGRGSPLLRCRRILRRMLGFGFGMHFLVRIGW
jgi:hypothetical protein